MRSIPQAIDYAISQIDSCLPAFIEKFPFSHSEGNFYEAGENVEWTTGFWTGELWLAYEHTHASKYKDAALRQVASFKERILNRIDVDHHDMGFLYSPSCVAAYKLTGREEGKEAALLAADNLVSRFQPKGQFIQAWGDLGAEDNYRLIIDCLLNLPLLFWATEESGDDTYRDIALKHIDTAMRVIIRDDDSTYHTYYFDTETGEPTKGVTRQGYRDGSAWSRGQAWGIYGAALAYRHTKNPKYFALFERMTKFFLAHLPADRVPYWDFDFTDGSDEPKDSSASAIAICGMHEMAKFLDEDKATFYRSEAEKLLHVLIDTCAAIDPKVSNGLLLHGTYARKSPYNPCNNRGVDECNTWGDFFYLEALMRFAKDWDSYW